MIPVLQRGQDGHVVGFQHIEPRREHIRQHAFMHEHGGLSFAHGQLGAVLDLVVFAFEPPDHRVARVIDPMDHIDEFTGQKIENTHGNTP